MKSHIFKYSENWRFFIGLHKRFQGFGFMWEEDLRDTIAYKRHYCIELRLFWLTAWFVYNRLVKN